MKQLAGSLGSVVAGACCLGLPPLIATLTGIGMGFLLHDAILIPLLLVMLGFTLWSLNASRKRHGQNRPLYFGMTSSLLAFVGLWILAPMSWVGFVGLIAVSIWDMLLMRKQGIACEPTVGSG